MSNKKKRPRGSSSTYRAPAKSAAPRRRGLLDGIFAPRTPGASPMPKLRSTLARGTATALSVPALLVSIPVVVLVVWVALVMLGFLGPFKTMAFVYAIPPMTTVIHQQIVPNAFRSGLNSTGAALALPGLLGAAGVILFHALIDAVVTTVAVEQLRTGSVSKWAIRRVPHVLKTTSVVGTVSLGLFIAGWIFLQLLGSIGFFAFLGVLVLGVYILGFAPAIAADEDRRLTDVLVRSVRVARMPGSGNLWLALAYVFACAIVLVIPLPGSLLGVTPSIGAWIGVICFNVVHVIMQSTLAYRYLVVAPEVPEQPVRQAPARRR